MRVPILIMAVVVVITLVSVPILIMVIIVLLSPLFLANAARRRSWDVLAHMAPGPSHVSCDSLDAARVRSCDALFHMAPGSLHVGLRI